MSPIAKSNLTRFISRSHLVRHPKPHSKQTTSINQNSPENKSNRHPIDNLHYYPTTTLDEAYISRYRHPSQHDNYTLSDQQQQPHTFRARPNATQPLPKLDQRNNNPLIQSDTTTTTKQSSFEAKLARLEMETSWASLLQNHHHTNIMNSSSDEVEMMMNNNMIKTKKLKEKKIRIGLCFPGSGSQYIGMGSFLIHSRAFQDTWDEAEQALIEFERWRKSLDLEDRLQSIGYTFDQSQLLGGPMRYGALKSSIDDPGLKHLVFNGPGHELTRSSNAQPAILVTSLAYLRALEVDYGTPILELVEAFAGHSSGEYTACVAAGVISFTNAVHLTRLHGLLTTRTLELNQLSPSTNLNAAPEQRAQMSALLINRPTYDLEDIQKVLIDIQHELNERKLGPVEIASVNSETQVVLSGSRAGVLAACERLSELEIANRAADLPCAAPFHCSFMKPASDGISIALESIPLNFPPKKTILLSSSSSSSSPNDPIKKMKKLKEETYLKNQLSCSIRSTVMWSNVIKELWNDQHQIDFMIYLGPGKALCNLGKKENYEKFDQIFSLATQQDFEKVVKEIKRI